MSPFMLVLFVIVLLVVLYNIEPVRRHIGDNFLVPLALIAIMISILGSGIIHFICLEHIIDEQVVNIYDIVQVDGAYTHDYSTKHTHGVYVYANMGEDETLKRIEMNAYDLQFDNDNPRVEHLKCRGKFLFFISDTYRYRVYIPDMKGSAGVGTIQQ